MTHKKHDHHHHYEKDQQTHHREVESKNVASGIVYSGTTTAYKFNELEYDKARKDEKHHKRMEHLGEMGAVAAGAFAMHEKHQVKKDPENAHRHKIEEKIAAAVAVGAGAYAVHEHHKREESKKKAKEIHGKKHHHHLF